MTDTLKIDDLDFLKMLLLKIKPKLQANAISCKAHGIDTLDFELQKGSIRITKRFVQDEPMLPGFDEFTVSFFNADKKIVDAIKVPESNRPGTKGTEVFGLLAEVLRIGVRSFHKVDEVRNHLLSELE